MVPLNTGWLAYGGGQDLNGCTPGRCYQRRDGSPGMREKSRTSVRGAVKDGQLQNKNCAALRVIERSQRASVALNNAITD